MADDLYLKRLELESEKQEAYERELLKIAAFNKLFFLECNQKPLTMEHLYVWAAEKYPHSINPYDVLTQDEIVQVWEDAENPLLQ